MNKLKRAGAVRILAFLLSALLLLSSSGCLPFLLQPFLSSPEESPEVAQSGINAPDERPIVTEGRFNNLDFEELCAVMFEHEVTSDSLSLNQLVVNPEDLDIEIPRPAQDHRHQSRHLRGRMATGYRDVQIRIAEPQCSSCERHR